MNDKKTAVEKFPKLAEAFADRPEMFPHAMAAEHERLARKIEALWGTREAMRYMDNLMLSDRQGRHGFSERVVVELATLKQIHEAAYPAISVNPHDPFAVATAEVARMDLNNNHRNEGGALGAAGRRAPVPEMPLPEPPPSRYGSEAAAALRRSPWREVREAEEFRAVLEARRSGEASPPKDGRRLGEILQEQIGRAHV